MDSKPTDEELCNRFIHHRAATTESSDVHIQVSAKCLDLARLICDTSPAGRHLALALTHLEEVRMRANAALSWDPKD